MWTQFWDMNSGGGRKEKWDCIYIEAPLNEAKTIFYNRFGHNPNRVTCTCCGEDYSIEENKSLAQLTGFHRGLRSVEAKRDPVTGLYNNSDPNIRYLEDGEEPPEGYSVSDFGRFGDRERARTLEEYEHDPKVLIIRASDIKPEERKGAVPAQGYIWVD